MGTVIASSRAFSTDGAHAYIVPSGDNAVAVQDTAILEITARIPVGTTPTAIALGTDGRYGYVINHASGTTAVVKLA